jgi:hypothetical protein
MLGGTSMRSGVATSRRRKDPLRPLTDPERAELLRPSRSAPATPVARAVALLAIAGGSDDE